MLVGRNKRDTRRSQGRTASPRPGPDQPLKKEDDASLQLMIGLCLCYL